MGKRIFVHHRIVSAVKTVEFVSNRVSYIYIVLRGCRVITLFWMCMNQVRRKVMIQNTVFMRN